MSSERGLLVVMTGPSGAGKTSMSRRLMSRWSSVRFSVSYTTRPPRDGEVHGLDYHFVDDSEFLRRMGDGEFLEHARVHGNRYGTHGGWVAEQVAAGAVVLLDIDVQGARQVRSSGADAVFLFVLPPDLAELERRLRGRATDADEVIERRLKTARAELAEAPWFDYLLVNDDLSQATDDFEAVLRAERLRRRRPAIARALQDQLSGA